MMVQPSIRILHVDDEPEFGDLTATFLERENDSFTVETATSADDGLESIRDSPPDCVVSDYDMPEQNGIEFLEEVREDYPELPFILFTGKGSEEVASDAISEGVTDYLQKGTGTEKYEILANRVENAVQARYAEERLSRKEELMRLTEIVGDVGGWELDLDTNELEMTEGAARLAGVSPENNLSLEESIEIYHPDDREDVRAAVERAIQTNEQVEGTWRFQTPDGDEGFVDVTITPVESNGEVTKLRGATRDVTERHEREQELKEQREFTQQALDALDDMFYVLDTEGNIERWNQQVVEVTGYEPEELDGLAAIELFPEEDQRTIADGIETALQEGEKTVEADLLNNDGQRIPHEWSGARLTDVDGDTTTGIVGVGRDITERKRRERELERYEDIVKNSSDIILRLGEDGTVLHNSPSSRQLSEYDREETIGDDALEYVHPDDREWAADRLRSLLNDPERNEDIGEIRMLDDDGSDIWVEASASDQTHTDADGVVVSVRDITERKQREKELERYEEFVRNSSDVITHIDEGGEILYQSPSVADVLGHEPGDRAGDNALEYVHPDDRKEVAEKLSSLVQDDRQEVGAELRYEDAEGEYVWIEVVARDRTDTEVGGVVVNSRDISERKKSELELKRYEAFIEKSSDIIVHLDEDGTMLYQSPGTETVFGHEPEVNKGENVLEYVHPEDRERVAEGYAERLADPDVSVAEAELRLEDADGEYVWTEAAGVDVTDTDLGGSIVRLRDITEQKERERELERYESIVENTSELITLVDEDGTLLYQSPSVERILGYDPETAVGNNVFEFVHPEDENWGEDELKEFLDNPEKEVRDEEYRALRADGEYVWLEGSFVDMRDTVLDGVLVVARDITERKQRERELRRKSEAIESAVEGIAIHDSDERFTYANEAHAEMHGYEGPDDFLGETWQMLYNDEETERIEDEALPALDENGEWSGEATAVRSDGTEMQEELSLSRMEEGCVVCVTRDITEQKERRKEIERQNERLEEFASAVSHDLRNPLSVAEGRLELAKEDCDSGHLDDVDGALERMEALIEDILTLAREGDDVGEMEVIETEEILEGCWENVETETATLVNEIEGEIEADPGRLKQLCENLVRNAVEHGGDDVTVTVGELEDKDRDGFYVADDGDGIPEDEREEVFEAGYSTAEDGTGFGLRIVRQIVQAHGWEIQAVESDEGGARFEVTGVETTE